MKYFFAYVFCSYPVNWFVLNYWGLFFPVAWEPTHAEKVKLLFLSPIMLLVEFVAVGIHTAVGVCERLV